MDPFLIRPRPRILRACLLAGLTLGIAVGAEPAGEPAFAETISVADQTAAGLSILTDGELAELNRLIQQEVTLARQGNVTGFAGTFTGRRTDGQRTATGLERLSAEQQAHLDTLVAYRLAAPTLVFWTPRATDGDRAGAVRRPSPFPIRSSVSLTYGAGSGGTSFYGGSMSMTYDDPSGKFSATVSISEYHIKGPDRDFPAETRGGRVRRR